jgi:hypothetical protein
MNIFNVRLIKYICPLFVILGPIMATYGANSPPSWAEEVLQKYDYHSKILTGISYKSNLRGEVETIYKDRSYILFPSFKTIAISFTSKTNQEDKVTFKESMVRSYIALLTYLASLFGTWWYWIRRKTPN